MMRFVGAALCVAAPGALAAQMHHAMSGMTDPAMPDVPPAAMTPTPMAMPMPAPMAMMSDGISTAGSGTARLPAADRMRGLMVHSGGWMLMAHGYAWGSYTDQGGPRGADKAFVQSMAMVVAQRPIAPTLDLTLRTMLSADPLMGERGYPNLFATGESAHGEPLVDRQHPHDLFMELAGRLDLHAGETGRAFVYAGLPGEPALGPAAFMHRGSARFLPEAPITHHWFDSTHITWGVLTAGWQARRWQLEASGFKGREPGENRWNIETPRIDSWAVRGTWMPGPRWAASLSYGALHSPEALHPETDERRLIASLSYSDGRLDVTTAYARKAVRPGRVLPAWLAEATWAATPRHALFGRVERLRTDELFEHGEPLAARPATVAKVTAGYAYSLPVGRSLSLALGAAASAYAKPDRLDAAYGRHPHSLTLFAKLMLGR